MRGTGVKPIWSFLLAIFLAVGAAVAILPGCSDDMDRGLDSGDSPS